MSIQYKELVRQNFLRVENWELPHVEPLESTYERLYAQRKVHFFPNAVPHPDITNYNVNQVQAAEFLSRDMFDREGTVFFVFAPMWGGKSATAAIVAGILGQRAQVFQHQLGFVRTNIEELAIKEKGGGWYRTDVQTKIYDSFSELSTAVAATANGVVIADEIQFSNLNRGELREWSVWLKKRQMKALLLGLDLSFLGTPWENTGTILSEADSGIVLAAQCMDCSYPAWMTSRTVILEDGRERPASSDDPVVLVGAGKGVLAGDYYRSSCAEHFALFSPKQAETFDHHVD